METLIRKKGGEPFVAPSVHERALDDQRGALEFVDPAGGSRIRPAGVHDGCRLSFLRGPAAADSADNATLARLAEGLRKTFIVSRGKISFL
jgi:hypothetical protein